MSGKVILLIPASALVAFVLACGGGDDDSGGSNASTGGGAPQAAPTTASSDAPAAPTGGGGPAASSDGAPGDDTAIITIGDNRYEFDVSRLCLSMFGAFGAAGPAADGSEVDLEMSLPPMNWQTRADSADWEPPSIRVDDDANNLDWRAGGEVVTAFGVDEAVSLVSDFSIDGNRASGTAIFIDFTNVQLGQTPEPVNGSFEVSCDDQPYS